MSQNNFSFYAPDKIAAVALVSLFILTGCAGRQVLTPEVKVAPGKEQKMLSGRLVPQKDKITVWFVRPSGDELTYVAVERPYKGQNTRADYLDFALKELTRGPNSDEVARGLASEVPKGAVLIDVKNAPGKDVTINVSRLFVQGGGLTSFETRMEQLRRTVDALAFDAKVYLDVEGERLTQTVGEGVEIKQPIN